MTPKNIDPLSHPIRTDFCLRRMAGRLTLIFLLLLSACATNQQSKVSGSINQLSKQQTVAILPIQTLNDDQKETATMFRQSLYANLKQAHFNLLERYIVDGLLEQNNMTDPSKFGEINPLRFGELLGADAVVISRINKVERSYMIVHSSIELSVSVEMIDTRTGEVLWKSEQNESDFQGIGKIPTGIAAAILAPIQFVTNKLNLQGLTSKMTSKMTALIKNPEDANAETTFDETVVVSSASRDLKEIEKMQQLKSEWEQSVKNEPDSIAEEMNSVAEALERHTPIPGESSPEETFVAQKEEVRESPQTPRFQNIKLAGKAFNVNVTTPASNEYHAPQIPKTENPAEEKREANATPGIARQQPASEPLYTVQVGAYNNKDSARKMADQLIKKGYNAFTSVSSSEKEVIYKVRVEKFSNKEKALQLAQKIQDKEKLSNFITTLNPG